MLAHVEQLHSRASPVIGARAHIELAVSGCIAITKGGYTKPVPYVSLVLPAFGHPC